MTDREEQADRWNEILPQLPGERFFEYKDRLIEHLEDQLKVARNANLRPTAPSPNAKEEKP